MPIIQDFNCDVVQEMNWVKGHNTIVGYVNKLTIAGTELPANITNLWDPIAGSNTMNVVGVMDYCFWSSEKTQPVRISFLVDNANQVYIHNLASAGLADTAMQIEFTVYNFDQQSSPPVFYPTFWTNAEPLSGFIAREADTLALNIERERDPRIFSPPLYRCDLAMAPMPSKPQLLYLANSSTAKYVLQFGEGSF